MAGQMVVMWFTATRPKDFGRFNYSCFSRGGA